MKIGILGSGSWGTALARVLADNGNEVLLYGNVPAEIEDIELRHQNTRYFGDLLLPETLHATLDITRLAEYSDIFLFAVPTKAFEVVLAAVKPYIREHTLLLNVAKGFSWDTGRRLSECLREGCRDVSYGGIVSLIGPSHAEEVVRQMLTSVAAVSAEPSIAETVQKAFSNDYFRVYVTTDEVGAEYGVAIKNIIALASGMLEGQGYGDNAKAALITRGLREMVRYGVSFGGKVETFFGLTGVGDLIVTCFSPHSRNYRAGLAIGKADSVAGLEGNKETVEGVHACLVVSKEAEARGIEMPIVSAVYRVLFENATPSEEIRTLMRRPLKSE